MAQVEELQLGGLHTLVVRGDEGGPVVALLHGYGADAWDLLPLHQVVAAPRGTTWLVPHAPHEVELGPHVTGRAWFPIDVMALQLAMMAGRHRDLDDLAPPELVASVAMVEAMLRDWGAPMEQTLLAGFSQGAMTATALTLQAKQAPAGLAILSGALLDQRRWQALAPRRAGLRFFQSHGRRDPMLSFDAAVRLHRMLTQAGWQGTFAGFDGGHEIPTPVLQGLSAFAAAVLAP